MQHGSHQRDLPLPIVYNVATTLRQNLHRVGRCAVFAFGCVMLPFRRLFGGFVSVIIFYRKPRATTIIPRFVSSSHRTRCPVATINHVRNALAICANPLEALAVHKYFIARQVEYSVAFRERKVVNVAIYFDSSTLLFRGGNHRNIHTVAVQRRVNAVSNVPKRVMPTKHNVVASLWFIVLRAFIPISVISSNNDIRLFGSRFLCHLRHYAPVVTVAYILVNPSFDVERLA